MMTTSNSLFEFLYPTLPFFQALLQFAHTKEAIFEVPLSKLPVNHVNFEFFSYTCSWFRHNFKTILKMVNCHVLLT